MPGAGLAMSFPKDERRASNGISFDIVGNGPPLLLLHGLMATRTMFDPFVELLADRFRMLVPDLRGHGKSGALGGPYDVAALAADLPTVLSEADFKRCAVLGYSHGGAVAQQLARAQPAHVERLMLVCTYACNVATLRERVEAHIFGMLLRLFSPATLASLVVHGANPSRSGEIGLTREQAAWLRAIMAQNRAAPMRGAARGLLTFDSRSWLKEIRVPTLVVGGTHDAAVPRHHFDTLVNGIPGAFGRLVERAGHTLIWTHTQELADVVCAQWRSA
jgi:pimeloyl-ACP methyl ester carboxylesterase